MLSIFAHVSRSPTARLNTGRAGVWSCQSETKYPVRSNCTWVSGETFASRHGLSHLSAVGLAAELSARSSEEYVTLAAELARDLDRPAELRAGLRERMARSPLSDGDRLADELLAALRTTWREWATHAETGR